MLSLLVVVFLIQLACHLILTIGSKPINDLLWQIYCRLPLGSSRDIQEQIRLRQEVVRLKREMNAISAQDEFSRWAKVRRQHDKALADHDQKAAAVSSSRASFDTKATAIRWLCTSGLRFGLQFWHAKTPVFTYPRGWFPWYIEWLLGFPRCPYGGVSINVWSLACGTVIALVWDVTIYAIQYVQEMKGGGQKVKRPIPIPAMEKSK
ncbi:GET complex subunit get1 [Exophiala xenobiotica]|uniref:GET complex subunit get1 n=1 Tax=Vermiconidia calcicola TaxID=1690605 RepID=A0AAV9QI88_9PEZI|nr:GET complex subunit get1 [Exophiala xenobiotica]KAK5543797.1 GET complex subunit get1 [Vermiconidia calcicola]KAK5548475.1 GET complex subunit get1 [Chaetothyriales sp. CCFEE 6169]KAK5197266.1 GET complex subunit get1 [Exophiala xenobiotica]KAK5237754.1 GET complex subunit get1 [Exophiala xenobiotica]